MSPGSTAPSRAWAVWGWEPRFCLCGWQVSSCGQRILCPGPFSLTGDLAKGDAGLPPQRPAFCAQLLSELSPPSLEAASGGLMGAWGWSFGFRVS